MRCDKWYDATVVATETATGAEAAELAQLRERIYYNSSSNILKLFLGSLNVPENPEMNREIHYLKFASCLLASSPRTRI